jgi:O-antigen ligase
MAARLKTRARADTRGDVVDRPTAPEVTITVATVAFPYVFHWLYGALVSEVALLLVATQAILLGAIIICPRLRRDLPSVHHLAPAGVLFLAVMAIAVFSLTPCNGAAIADIWALVNRRAMGTLDRSATSIEIVKLAGLASAFLAAAAIGRSRKRLNLALSLTVYFGAAFALLSVLLSSADAIYATQGRRVEARFLNPNTAGVVFGSLSIVALAVIWKHLSSGRARLRPALLALDTACFAILASALLSTISRGALAATMIAAAALFAWELSVSMRSSEGWLRVRAAAALIGCLAVAAGVGWAFFDRVGAHLFDIEEDVKIRSLTAVVHWRAIGASPWFGFGLGTFEAVNTMLFTSETFSALWNIRAAQNVYIQWVEQAGWLGSLCMFGCIAMIVAGPIRAVCRDERAAWRSRALIAVNLVFLIHGMVDFSLETYSVAAFWALLLGLNFGVAAPAKRSGGPKVSPLAAGALALTCLTSAALCMVSLDGALAAGPDGPPVAIAAGLDRASDLLVATAITDGDRGPELTKARALSWAALRQAPCDTGAWLRLAEIDVAASGELGPTGISALRGSYRVAPVDPYQVFWRTRFVLEHWGSLPQDIMDDADREVAGAAASSAHRDRLAATLNDVVSPRGRMVATLWTSLYKLPVPNNSPDHEAIGG